VIVELGDQPDVVAVIPTLGGNVGRLHESIASLMQTDTTVRLAVVVVWNDPRNPIPEFEMVTVLKPGMNLGFPGALNHARRHIDAEFLWVMQDDVRVTPDCLDNLLHRMSASDHPALVAPVFLDPDGMIPANSRAGIVGPEGEMESWYPFVATAPENFDRSQPLDWVASSGSLARLSAWDAVGGWDPDFYPVIWSDVDFGFRLRRAGFVVALEPDARIEHDINGSTPSLLAHHLFARNGERFRAKNFPAETAGDSAATEDDQSSENDGVSDAEARQVARAASLALLDFATYASAAWQRQQQEIRSLRVNEQVDDGQ
jgi:N-acetylglucosaminyl-diphospho-decaprenol L-rhamnosyltransferase